MKLATILAGVWLLGAAAPAHVQTADYFGGYAGTRAVAPSVAARWLTWAETNVADSLRVQPLGIKTLLYTDPNRQIAGQAYFARDESAFAHDCAGGRVTTNRSGQYLMDPGAPALQSVWKQHVDRYTAAGRFDAVFEDDADDVAYVRGVPCNFDQRNWTDATIALQRSIGFPVVYNGLSNFSGENVSTAIDLNATALGGMMEQCYATSPAEPKSSGSKWRVTETTELQMAAQRKLFFCYGNDTTPANAALDGRLYAIASFLLTYDPATSVLWEYYGGTAAFHVMPEVQLAPLQPRAAVRSIADLRAPSGVFERAYAACYFAGRNAGPCVVAVNPDAVAHALTIPGYARTLELDGGNVLDGGAARIVATRPPAQLAPAAAAIAFR